MPNAPEAPCPDLGDILPDVTGPAGVYCEEFAEIKPSQWALFFGSPPCTHFSPRKPD